MAADPAFLLFSSSSPSPAASPLPGPAEGDWVPQFASVACVARHVASPSHSAARACGPVGDALFLDVRGADAYLRRRVRHSISATGSTILQRRLQRGSLNAYQLIAQVDRARFQGAVEQRHTLYVYDDSYSSACQGGSSALLYATALSRETDCPVLLVDGGFQALLQHLPSDLFETGPPATSCLMPSDLSARCTSAAGSNSPASAFGPCLAPPHLHLVTPPPLQHPEAASSLQGFAVPQNRFDPTRPVWSPGPPTRVIPRLFVGSAADAGNRQWLAENNIKFVLNCTQDCPNFFPDDHSITYLRIPVADTWSTDLAQYFPKAIAFVLAGLQSSSDAGVLIHCMAGVSRSPTVMMAFLMSTQRIELSNAYQILKALRPCIAPNLNFMGGLLKFQQSLQAQDAAFAKATASPSPSPCAFGGVPPASSLSSSSSRPVPFSLARAHSVACDTPLSGSPPRWQIHSPCSRDEAAMQRSADSDGKSTPRPLST